MIDSPCMTMAAGQCAQQLSSRYWAGHNLTEVCSSLNTTQQFSSIFSEAEGEASSILSFNPNYYYSSMYPYEYFRPLHFSIHDSFQFMIHGAISDSDVCLQFACCSGLQPHVLSVLQITAGPSWILELQERSSGHLPVLQLKHRHTQYSVKAVSSEFSLMKVPNFSFQMGKI